MGCALDLALPHFHDERNDTHTSLTLELPHPCRAVSPGLDFTERTALSCAVSDGTANLPRIEQRYSAQPHAKQGEVRDVSGWSPTSAMAAAFASEYNPPRLALR